MASRGATPPVAAGVAAQSAAAAAEAAAAAAAAEAALTPVSSVAATPRAAVPLEMAAVVVDEAHAMEQAASCTEGEALTHDDEAAEEAEEEAEEAAEEETADAGDEFGGDSTERVAVETDTAVHDETALKQQLSAQDEVVAAMAAYAACDDSEEEAEEEAEAEAEEEEEEEEEEGRGELVAGVGVQVAVEYVGSRPPLEAGGGGGRYLTLCETDWVCAAAWDAAGPDARFELLPALPPDGTPPRAENGSRAAPPAAGGGGGESGTNGTALGGTALGGGGWFALRSVSNGTPPQAAPRREAVPHPVPHPPRAPCDRQAAPGGPRVRPGGVGGASARRARGEERAGAARAAVGAVAHRPAPVAQPRQRRRSPQLSRPERWHLGPRARRRGLGGRVRGGLQTRLAAHAIRAAPDRVAAASSPAAADGFDFAAARPRHRRVGRAAADAATRGARFAAPQLLSRAVTRAAWYVSVSVCQRRTALYTFFSLYSCTRRSHTLLSDVLRDT